MAVTNFVVFWSLVLVMMMLFRAWRRRYPAPITPFELLHRCERWGLGRERTVILLSVHTSDLEFQHGHDYVWSGRGRRRLRPQAVSFLDAAVGMEGTAVMWAKHQQAKADRAAVPEPISTVPPPQVATAFIEQAQPNIAVNAQRIAPGLKKPGW